MRFKNFGPAATESAKPTATAMQGAHFWVRIYLIVPEFLSDWCMKYNTAKNKGCYDLEVGCFSIPVADLNSIVYHLHTSIARRHTNSKGSIYH